MKKLLLSFGLLATGCLGAMAQKYDAAKNMIILQQWDKAKEIVDKEWSNPKYLAKPEAYILKSAIYAQLGNMPDKGDAGKAMVDEAEGLYRDYLKKDPARSLITDPAYANTPIVLYTNLVNRGIAEYNNKDYKKALALFEKSLYYSSYLNETKIAALPLDTNGQLLAGAAAQNIGDPAHDKIAMSHYKVLADAKVAGEDGNTIYRFLARKSFDYEDIESFKKYMALGHELYPKEEFYTYEEEAFLFGIEDQKEKLRRIEKKLQTNPNNYMVQAAYGEYLFDLLNPKDIETPLPANYDKVQDKMVGAFEKAASLDPASPLAVMNLANHFMNKSIRSSNTLADHQKMMRDKLKTNTPDPVKGKPAPKAPPADPADMEKRKELQTKYEAEILKAGSYYEAAAGIYSKMPELKNMDKQNYRNAVSYLIDINKDLKNGAIRDRNIANEAKYAAAEKKYMDLHNALNK